MKAMTANNAVHYNTSENHTSALKQWFKAYVEACKESFWENKTMILCGIAATGGSLHMYPTYHLLRENEKADK